MVLRAPSLGKTIFFLVFMVLFFTLEACQNSPSHRLKFGDRSPDSISEGDSCFDLMLPLVDEFQALKKGDWDGDELAKRELIDEGEWLAMREDESWQKFISRENQSDEEREMGFIVLSLLKKRFPKVDEKRLKDRYRVLMAFCGR